MNLKELSKHIRIGKLEIFLCLVFLFLLLYPFPTGGDRFFWKYFFDAGHPVLFFLCTFLIYRIYLPEVSKSKRRVIIEAATISFLISACIELIQPLMGRSASLEDLSLGALGIIPATFIISPIPVLKIAGPFVLFFVQCIAMAPATKAMHAIKWRKEHFPLLANFEDSRQFELLRGVFYIQKYKDNQYIKAYQPDGDYFLIRYEAGDKDWSKYKFLNMEILNPLEEDSIINIRIDDDQDCDEVGTRFVKQLDLKPGWNKISISTDEIKAGPKDRELDLRKIRYVFYYLNEGSQWFGIDNIFLSN